MVIKLGKQTILMNLIFTVHPVLLALCQAENLLNENWFRRLNRTSPSIKRDLTMYIQTETLWWGISGNRDAPLGGLTS